MFYRLFSYIPVFLYLKLFMIFLYKSLSVKLSYKVFYEVFYRASTRYSMWYSIGLINQDEHGKVQDFKSLLFTFAEFKWNLILRARAETKKKKTPKAHKRNHKKPDDEKHTKTTRKQKSDYII